jgi:endogenous inhibitor of DNA gyrase (YacG/DUF329 family)
VKRAFAAGAQWRDPPPRRPAVKTRIVKCPICQADVPWTPESKWRPFCSQRCKTIDLGAWASERYRVQTPEAPDAFEAGDGTPRDDAK